VASKQNFFGALLATLGVSAAAGAAGQAPDAIYVNATVYTVDATDQLAEALAVRAGRITYVGTSAGARALAGPATTVTDLKGRFVMPGLVDGHMHPLEGGQVLLTCNLDYERLTVAQMQARIQSCLDASRDKEPDQWLRVTGWFREAMMPNGVTVSRATLDALKTKRPIFVMSSFGHTALVNSRALKIAGFDAKTPDPTGGQIAHEPSGAPSGVLEDRANEVLSEHIPPPTPKENVQAAIAALEAMRRQGITSFFDAAGSPDTDTVLAAFAGAAKAGAFSARGHFAVHINPEEGRRDAHATITHARALADRYDQGAARSEPSMRVHNIKLFMDGVITAPTLTGAMLEPYFVNTGTKEQPHWAPGKDRGPETYYPPTVLAALLDEAARVHLEPHMHADGDRAVRAALDGVASLRKKYPESAIRAAIAHDEIVNPADFPRYKELGAIPVLSFQWEKRAPDTVDGALEYLGAARYRYIEPAGYLAAAGARLAYGSDWPVDALNEWFALKVGVTRENDPAAGAQYAGRLSSDPGLTLAQALRAITANAAYELHAENEVGSLEAGKFADFIVLDRNLLRVPAAQIADVKVLQTVVGGRTVYAADK
jgi:predicted amidohydrolase YtcJ